MVDLTWAAALAEDLTADRLLELTRNISQEVRLSGTEEELRSAKYVKGVLEAAGVETMLTFHDAYISLPGPAEIRVGDEKFACITHSFAPPSGPDGAAGELADIPSPASAADGRVRGKVAILDGLAMTGWVAAVEAGGAVAEIFVNGDLTHEMIVSGVWGSPGMAERHRYPKIPVVSVTSDVGKKLRERLRAGPVEVRVFSEVDTGWRKTPLLIGNVKAPGTDDFVLLSGHLDSWHLGAMDNGGANALMCEAARIFASQRDRLRRGLRVAFWSGHSHGRYSGSAWYADTHWRELRDHCVAHVNVDSIGGMGATVLTEGVAMASTRSVGAEAIAQVAHAEFEGARNGRAGDQSFVALGVPSLWMSLSEQPMSDHPTARALSSATGNTRSGGLGWWWHTVEDTIDKLDPDFLLRDARIYVIALGRLLGEPLLPLSAAAEAGELVDRLEELDSAAKGRLDLKTTVVAARKARAAGTRLDQWRNSQSSAAGGVSAGVFNKAVARFLQGLVVANYSAYGPYGQDPAAGMKPLPQLDPVRTLAGLDPDSDEAHLMTVDLVRARNRVEDLILQATEAAELALADLR
jgi:Peptidase family M28